jgi:hypothetical protein
MITETSIQSAFLDKKVLARPSVVRLLKQCIVDEVVEAVSVWRCLSLEGEELSCGANVFRKALPSEAPRKLVSFLKVKAKNDQLFVDGLPSASKKYRPVLDLLLQAAKL